MVTGSYDTSDIYVFADADGQTLGSALSATAYVNNGDQWAMTTAGGQAYGAQQFGGAYEQFANNGSFTPIANLQAAGLSSYLVCGLPNGTSRRCPMQLPG